MLSESKPKKQNIKTKDFTDFKLADHQTNKIGSSNSKKSLKNTPHHSKEKSKQLPHTYTPKLITSKSDYYLMSESHNKLVASCSQQDQNPQYKKSRRNNHQNNKLKEKNAGKAYEKLEKNDYQQPVIRQDSDHENGESNKRNPLFKKIKMLSSEGSIDFNGDIVRKTRLQSQFNKNSLVQRSSYYSPAAFECKKSSKKKSHSKADSSYGKKLKKNSKSKQKDKKNQKNDEGKAYGKSKDKHPENFHMYCKNGGSQKRSYLMESYQGPFPLPNQQQLQQLHHQIQEDAQNVYQYILSQELIKERGQCLNMLGKICSSMNLKRETFAIAMCYIDSFIDINTEIKNIKTIVIASLMMGLKLDHAEAVSAGNQLETLSSLQSMTMNKGLSISTEARSQEKRSSGKKQSSKILQEQGSKQPKFNLNRPKLPNVLTTVLSHEQIFSQYDRILCKEEIMDMEMQMMVKLNFKLTLKSYTYWIEALTNIWDSFVCKSRPKLKGKITFRIPESFKHLSYLFQLVEISYYFPYAYFYPKSILVLSIMYLLVRIWIQFPAEKEEKGFEHYKNNLSKSTNIIFVDKMGTNEIFGEFLGLLQLDMGDIVNCCQYASHYLSHKILRMFAFDGNRSMTYEQHTAIYHYNPEIYRFFQLKYSNCMDRSEA